MYIRTVLTYASPVFAHAVPKVLDRLQVIQNKFCRDATDAYWYVSNLILHRDLELPTIAKFMKDTSKRFATSRDLIPMRSFVQQSIKNHLTIIILSVGHGMYLPIHLTLQRQ
ncbi:hypothetical protein EVAR_30578_1 [Eumeta japonica]|uniref:Uncharacterized protein n=1 Tax=Eumeta variegata TaxID=151549 RepID=A0A4C1VQP2_EUMVA|nr:hypothetical protein EVAR_30578_1 [Eumeta japonica]